MGPIIGALIGGGANAIFGGGGGGGLGGMLSNLMKGGLSGLFNSLSNLFGGSQQSNGANDAQQQTEQLLGDIKNMLGELLDKKNGGACGGPSHGAGQGECGAKPMPYHGEHGCEGPKEPVCHAPKEPECHAPKEPECHAPKEPACCDGGETEWDGQDKSPSLDREQGAVRLLEQAKDTHDPEQKRELIDMALKMLGEGGDDNHPAHGCMERHDGNSYDKDIVEQANKMLEGIDEGDLNDCNESKALDSVIEMLMEEGGVDGKPAASDTNGNGRRDGFEGIIDRPMPFVHHHGLHHALFDDH